MQSTTHDHWKSLCEFFVLTQQQLIKFRKPRKMKLTAGSRVWQPVFMSFFESSGAMKDSSKLHVENLAEVVLVRLSNETLFDPVSIKEMHQQLLTLVACRKPRKMIIDFDNVTRCSTSVINTLLVVKKRLLSEDGEMKLCGVADNVRHTFRILHLDGTVFNIYDSLDDAVAAFDSADTND